MNTRLLMMFFALLAACAAGSVTAAVPADPWYVGGGYGIVNTDASASQLQQALVNQGYNVTSVTLDKPNTGWKLYAGFQFHPNWAVELGYAELGEVTSHVTASGVLDVNQFVQDALDAHDFSANGVTLDLMGMVHTGPVALFAKLGGVHYKADVKVYEVNSGINADRSQWGTGLHYSAGAMLPVYQNRVNLRGEWERFRISGEWIDLYSLNVEYHFGG
ncbi:MAG: outer membrane beta-barrel protein [Gammaproteobacteria bacterium]|nr:outer membrane beta-barrel protein [Gammaproteobacteria bacterium]MDE2346481.1 outer membrane beta-barrel protein [Gammaproteobacteria bacterium]